MTVWFTADTHFGHRNILIHSNRPWSCVEDMDEALIARWNDRVKRGDHVWHLGDFTWYPPRTTEYLARLNGEVHLIMGNHDRPGAVKNAGFVTVESLRRIKVEEQDIVLCHYAMRVWQKSHYGAWMLYGHSHGTLPDNPDALSIDVGVDTRNYAPISFEEVREIMKGKRFVPVDHHGEED